MYTNQVKNNKVNAPIHRKFAIFFSKIKNTIDFQQDLSYYIKTTIL